MSKAETTNRDINFYFSEGFRLFLNNPPVILLTILFSLLSSISTLLAEFGLPSLGIQAIVELIGMFVSSAYYFVAYIIYHKQLTQSNKSPVNGLSLLPDVFKKVFWVNWLILVLVIITLLFSWMFVSVVSGQSLTDSGPSGLKLGLFAFIVLASPFWSFAYFYVVKNLPFRKSLNLSFNLSLKHFQFLLLVVLMGVIEFAPMFVSFSSKSPFPGSTLLTSVYTSIVGLYFVAVSISFLTDKDETLTTLR